MNDGMTILNQHKASLDEYYALVKEPGQVNIVFTSHVHFATRILIYTHTILFVCSTKKPNLDAIPWFGPTPDGPENMYVTNKQDMPGWDVSFDDVNIHFHGMQIVPHLFYPQGTANPVSNNGLVICIRYYLP